MNRPSPLLCLIALGALGCPAEVPPPAPDVAPASGTRDAPPPLEPEPADATRPESAPLSRDELLAISPADVLAQGLRGDGPHGLAEGLAGTGALAISEQTRAEGTPKQALALSSVIFRRAAESIAAGEAAPHAVHEKLKRDIEVQAGDQPRLKTWLDALHGACESREEFAAAATFLGQAHLMADQVDATRNQKTD